MQLKRFVCPMQPPDTLELKASWMLTSGQHAALTVHEADESYNDILGIVKYQIWAFLLSFFFYKLWDLLSSGTKNWVKMRKCVAYGCKSGYKTCSESVHMFTVPSDKKIIRLWQIAIFRDDKTKTWRCSLCKSF